MSYKIVGKYIKDLKFSIPNPKVFFLLSSSIKNYKVNIEIKSNQVEKNILEVLTCLSLTPSSDVTEKIEAKIILSTLIEISEKKLEKDELEKILLISVPSEIYAELRALFVNLFENSGFKDIKISDQIDFKKLYDDRKVQ